MAVPAALVHCGGGNGKSSAGTTPEGDAGSGTLDGGPGARPEAMPCEMGSGGGSCGQNETCCAGFCTDTSKDPFNCGRCGNACSQTQFCTGTTCDDAVLKNLCVNPHATVVMDPYMEDNTAGNAFGAALSRTCMPGVNVRSTSQSSGIAQDPGGRPLTGVGDTLVAGGGWFGQAAVAYMDSHGLTPLLVSTDGTSSWIRNSKTQANIVFIPNTSLTAHHDYFLFEVGVEPISGTLSFFGYGMSGLSTTVASYYFQKSVLPNASAFPSAWYVYEWTDKDMDGIGSAGDTFNPIANGM
jgi:hypothetical protein